MNDADKRPAAERKQETWCVVRLDDNGNEFPVSEGLSFEEAETLARSFESKGHKQTYCVRKSAPLAGRDI